MIAYLDSSVMLRVAFGEDNRLADWSGITTAASSSLARVECLRTVDRERIRLGLSDDEVVRRSASVFDILARIKTIELTPAILDRAAQPFPTTLATLDALHLASALFWQEALGDSVTLATHDTELGRAARALGMTVVGC